MKIQKKEYLPQKVSSPPPPHQPTDYSQKGLFIALKHYMQLQSTDEESHHHFEDVFCSGLSLCFSTFFLLKKRLWWTSLLKAIINSQALFSTSGYLDEPALDWQLPQQASIQTHSQLIERVINYVTFSNACPFRLAYYEDMGLSIFNFHQLQFLASHPPLSRDEKQKLSRTSQINYEGLIRHEYVSNHNVETIKSSASIAAYFSPDLLANALELNGIEGNIMTITNEEHECTLIYHQKNKQFGFYDPDSTSGDVEWFNGKEALVNHIFEALETQLLVLECASTNQEITFFNNFKQAIKHKNDFLNTYPLRALPFVFIQSQQTATMVLSRYIKLDDKIIPKLIHTTIEKYAIEDPREGYIPFIIQTVFNHPSFKNSMYNQLLHTLNHSLSDGKTLFYHLATTAPEWLLHAFDNQQPYLKPKRPHFFSGLKKVELGTFLRKTIDDDKTLLDHLEERGLKSLKVSVH